MMKAEATALPGVALLTGERHDDERGWFAETFSRQRFEASLRTLGLPMPGAFVQDNHSCSAAGVLRGLHYQVPPQAQGKLVRVLRGASFHVAVDLRRDSPQFARWVGVELSGLRQLWIPEGFAHGFLALQDATEVAYKTTALYARDAERAIVWNDPALAIGWPLRTLPRLSARDAAAPRLADSPTF